MKKILYAIGALCVMSLSSCSNDDIEITTVGELHTLTYSVQTQGLYDEFDLTEDIKKKYLRDENYYIGVDTYVYDESGNLKLHSKDWAANYNNIVQTLSVPSGKYTIVTIETLVHPSYEYESNAWDYVDVDKLSTLKIESLLEETKYPYVLGVCNSTLTVTGNSSVSCKPKAIGSMLELYFDGWEKSDYVNVGFVTQDKTEYYRLDPSLDRSDRYVIDLSASGIIKVRCKNSINSDLIRRTIYILDNEIQYSFAYQDQDQVSAGGSYWWTLTNKPKAFLEDGKTYYACYVYVDKDHEYQILANSYTEMSEWLINIKQPKPQSSIVPDVCKEWGCTVSNVQSMMSGYTMTLGSSGSAVKEGDNLYVIDYEGIDPVKRIEYAFTSSTSGLFEADLYYENNSENVSAILEYLEKEYALVAQQDEIRMFIDENFTTYIMYFYYEGMINVGFVDINYVANMSASPKKASVKNMLERIDKEKINSKKMSVCYAKPFRSDLNLDVLKAMAAVDM